MHPLPPHLHLLLSLTAADALGAATEFKTPAQISQRYSPITTYQPGSPFNFQPGEATDDSQMTVATIIGYTREAGLSGVYAALRDWISTSPPDVGGLTRSALAHPEPTGGFHAWLRSGRQPAGNGGLMRIAATIITGHQGEELLTQAACVTALTHADPRCVIASIFFVAFLEEIRTGETYAHAIDAAWQRMVTFPAIDALLDAQLLPEQEAAAYRERYAADLPTVLAHVRDGLHGEIRSQSGFVLDTLQAALAHGQHASWIACVQPAVMLGDDSDTVACVTGAIAGARRLPIPDHLLPSLRLGHSWPGWQREWRCVDHYPQLFTAPKRSTGL